MNDLSTAPPICTKPSPIHGKGAFLMRPVGAVEYIGPTGKYLAGVYRTTELGAMHNHSENPSCVSVIVGDIRFLVSIEPMRAGDEITVDYRMQKDLEQPPF